MSIADKLTSRFEKTNDLRLKAGVYILFPVYISYLLFQRHWNELYLILCPFLAYGIAYAYIKYCIPKKDKSGLNRPIDTYLFILPSVFLVLVTFGYAVFGIDYRSEIYRISFVLIGIIFLWFAAAGIFMLKQTIPVKCERCKARARFDISHSDREKSNNKSYCFDHFITAFHEAMTNQAGYYLIIEPSADQDMHRIGYTFYNCNELVEYEYEDEDIERIKKLLSMVKQKAADYGSRDAFYALIPSSHLAPENEDEEIRPLFGCDPTEMRLQYMNYRDFKHWLIDLATRIEQASGKLGMDIPNAKSGIYILD